MSLEEKSETLMKSYQTISSSNQELQRSLDESEGQNAYLHKQLSKSLKQKQRILESPSGSNLDEVSEAKSQHSEYEGEAEPRRTPRKEWRPPTNSNDFRIDIPEFEGKLDPDEFLEWLHTIK